MNDAENLKVILLVVAAAVGILMIFHNNRIISISGIIIVAAAIAMLFLMASGINVGMILGPAMAVTFAAKTKDEQIGVEGIDLPKGGSEYHFFIEGKNFFSKRDGRSCSMALLASYFVAKEGLIKASLILKLGGEKAETVLKEIKDSFEPK